MNINFGMQKMMDGEIGDKFRDAIKNVVENCATSMISCMKEEHDDTDELCEEYCINFINCKIGNAESLILEIADTIAMEWQENGVPVNKDDLFELTIEIKDRIYGAVEFDDIQFIINNWFLQVTCQD